MLHLESWRNRYRTDDMMPLFMRRLELNPRFSPSQKQALREVYHAHPLFQRLVFGDVSDFLDLSLDERTSHPAGPPAS